MPIQCFLQELQSDAVLPKYLCSAYFEGLGHLVCNVEALAINRNPHLLGANRLKQDLVTARIHLNQIS